MEQKNIQVVVVVHDFFAHDTNYVKKKHHSTFVDQIVDWETKFW